ncbi:MAG: type II toxin-antitoxin system MqsA family antitoxin [Candidatus Contendobacter sp.]|nr:type II toxin-antitoxin system MqsA family antitoxin [Candidatus Contendobacter sp.]
MTKLTEDLELCPACRKGCLMAAQYTRAFELKGKHVEVQLQTSVCDACGETTTKASQHRENLRALAERKTHYGNVLMGEEILALRKHYGLTQQQASTIFGKGKIAFSRYESETSYPDESTTLLLTLAIEKAEVMKCLADKAGVELPLWPERCEDDRGVKLRLIQGARVPAMTMRQQTMQPDFSPGPFASNMLLGPVRPIIFPVASNDSVDLPEVVVS